MIDLVKLLFRLLNDTPRHFNEFRADPVNDFQDRLILPSGDKGIHLGVPDLRHLLRRSFPESDSGAEKDEFLSFLLVIYQQTIIIQNFDDPIHTVLPPVSPFSSSVTMQAKPRLFRPGSA